jgi:hypothetical protein
VLQTADAKFLFQSAFSGVKKTFVDEMIERGFN